MSRDQNLFIAKSVGVPCLFLQGKGPAATWLKKG